MNFIQRSASLIIFLSVMASLSSGQITPNSQNYALIFPKTGDGFAANILRIEKDSLVLYTNDYKYIAKKDVGKIIIHAKKESGKGFATGSILGIYAMNYWLGTANGQPGGFLWDGIYGNSYRTSSYYYSETPLAIVGIALLGVAIGGGVGYLLDLGHDANSEMIYLFGGSVQLQEEQWAKAQEAIEHGTRKGKFHVNIAGGLIFPNVSNAYRDQLTAAGYNTNNSYGSYYYDSYNSGSNFAAYQRLQGSSDFNWLRSISASYSVTDNMQFGLCYALLGEPSFVYTNNPNVIPLSNSQSARNFIVGQRLDGRVYYATAAYIRSFGKKEDFELALTGGIGFANIRFDLNSEYTLYDSLSNTSTNQIDNISIHQSYLSAMASASLSYYLYDSFSLGLKASYFYAGNAVARAIPNVFLNEQNLVFGNADIGFTIGMHF